MIQMCCSISNWLFRLSMIYVLMILLSTILALPSFQCRQRQSRGPTKFYTPRGCVIENTTVLPPGGLAGCSCRCAGRADKPALAHDVVLKRGMAALRASGGLDAFNKRVPDPLQRADNRCDRGHSGTHEQLGLLDH